MPRAIPDRWEDYAPIGEPIEGTRFIAFKVPLREIISSRVEKEKRLDDRILLDKIPSLGLIIDLTNTSRYYDPEVFQRNGIKHKKIMIPGKETPPQNLTDKFICVVKDYLKRNKDNDKLIGVHCTHGVNRTGYLICNYMISQMTVAPQEAMERFANARGHKIERTNYIQALQKLPEINLQNGIKPPHPENWREKHRSQPENWRERHENDKNNYHRDVYRNRTGSRGNSRDRYISYRKSRSRSRSPHDSRRCYERRTDNSYSYRRPSDRANEVSNNTSAERHADHHCTMSSRRPPVLRLDYYNTRTTYDPKRYSYKRPDS